jgi:hypothetical protein
VENGKMRVIVHPLQKRLRVAVYKDQLGAFIIDRNSRTDHCPSLMIIASCHDSMTGA